MPIVQCSYCGEDINKKPSRVSKHNFCDRECMGKFHTKKITVKCGYCGKDVKKVPSDIYKHSFCNAKCMGKARQKQIKTPCNYCGKIIYKKEIYIKSHKTHFCNIKCHGKFHKKAHEIKTKNIPYSHSREILSKAYNLVKITEEIQNAKSKTTN